MVRGSIVYRPASVEELPAIAALDSRNFGAKPLSSEQVEVFGRWLDLDRSMVAIDRNRIVAFAGSTTLELTVPGPTVLPMRGVTWVSVSPTHTRRGVLRRLMSFLDEQAAERGESVLGLQASEAGIYERFGYGTSTFCRVVEIDRRATGIDPRYRPDRSSVLLHGLAERSERLDHMLAVYDRYRRAQVGERSMSRADLDIGQTFADEGTVYAEHPDGYANFTREADWRMGHPAHVLSIGHLVAATPQAHLDLWDAILATDLVGPIRSISAVGPADPLPYLLTNPRNLRTVEFNDFTWLKVIEPVTAFAARSYRTDGDLVMSVANGDSFRVRSDGGVASAAPSDDEPDLVVEPAALGPLLLGSVSATRLAAGRRLTGSPATLTAADVFFGHEPVAHSQVGF